MYQIEEISEQTGERFKELCLAHGVNLGDRRLEGEINRILTMIQRNARHRFLLIWTGSKVPRGAIVLGYQIVWTQNGEVLAKRADLLTGNPNTDMSIRGEQIGTYDRLLENGGKEGKDQVMIIHLSTRFT